MEHNLHSGSVFTFVFSVLRKSKSNPYICVLTLTAVRGMALRIASLHCRDTVIKFSAKQLKTLVVSNFVIIVQVCIVRGGKEGLNLQVTSC